MERFNDAFQHLDKPFAWVDLDALDANIAFVASKTAKSIRLATKSIRSVKLLRYIADRLPQVAGFMTFTAAETVYLAERGFDHFLLGYPVMERQAIQKLLYLLKEGKDITFMVDHIDQVKYLVALAKPLHITVPICIDINVSIDFGLLYFGTKRSPLHSYETVSKLLGEIAEMDVDIKGVMAYEAQVAGVADLPNTTLTSRMKSILIKQLKNKSFKQIEEIRQETLSIIRHLYSPIFINGGGSGSMDFTNTLDVTEITVGSAFLAPALFDRYQSLTLQKASGFALDVVRQFDTETVVCHGGGYIASGAPGHDRLPSFYEEERFQYVLLEGAGEVQTPIIDKEQALKIGDTVYFRHAKAGELCERFLALHAIRGNQYVGSYSTYRGDGQCFL
ncbi:alanine racemase [Lysinibacillus sp. LZ02]|uniref:alanine racemase n=1 Tax=Lysinibacillus sp. LZ02 TaxID=3420668 RepID=UPI003D365EF5